MADDATAAHIIAGFLNDSIEELFRECEAQGPGRYVVCDAGGNRFAFDYLGKGDQ